MNGTLPGPYPDELLYSVCARYCDRMQYPSKRSAVRELFGTENVIATVGLPSHIDDFVAALPPGHHYTADLLIDNHTLLPFYGPFLPPERLGHLREDMRGRNGPAIHMRAGIMASHVSPPEWLRLCPHCIEEDRRKVGECYWHRVHQVPGVEVCPVHEVCLYYSDVCAQNVKTRYEFVPAERAAQWLHQPDLPDSPNEILLKIAHDVHWLLSSRGLSQGLEALNARYREMLSALGLASYRGRVNAGALLERFRSYYSSSLLHLLQCQLDERVGDNWLLRLIRTPRNAQHPLHHLLLIYFLGHIAQTFFSLPIERKPFGEGPWPCLNPACNHYRQYRIRECQVVHSKYVNGRPIGIFSCDCGFVYSRTGPDTSSEDWFKLSRVKTFGCVWETRLCMLWEDEEVSLRGIAHQLEVDPLTVKRHATRLGLVFPRPVCKCLPLKETLHLHPHATQLPEPATLEAYQVTWLSAMQEDPSAEMKELRNKIPGVYIWLYRNDGIWLSEHTPQGQKKGKQQSCCLDWEKRDMQLAEEVKGAVLRLKNLPGRPVHVTVSAIGREIGRLALLQQHLDRLPRTAKALDELIETRESFAVRRVRWVAEQYRQDHMHPTRWELVKKAGIERVAMLPAVKEAVEAELQVLR